MGFDIQNLHIETESPEGQILQAIISRDRVTPEEAVLQALRDRSEAQKSPAEELIGLFSSPEDRDLLDEVQRMSLESRALDSQRDFDL